MDPIYVALDAEAIVSANFQYGSGRLDRLVEYADSGRLTLVMSEVTIREIEKKIAERVQEADQAARRFRDKARILRNSNEPSFASIFEELDSVSLTNHLQKQWHTFLDNIGAEVIPIDDVAPSAVFERYFVGAPPFGDGKKKSEFPDAFAAAAIEQWARAQGLTVTIVTSDRDLHQVAAASDVLNAVERVDALLELLATQDDEVAPVIAQALWTHLSDLDDSVASLFKDLGFYLSDQEGDVNEVRVEQIAWSELYVTEVDGGVVHFEARGALEYEADVTYEDMSRATWDSEDKRYLFVDTVDSTVGREEDVQVSGEAYYRLSDPIYVEVTAFNLQNGDVGVQVEHWLDLK